MDSAGLVVSSQKKNFSFGFGVLLGGVTSGGFVFLWPALHGPDAHLMGPRFGPNIFMKLGYLTSL